MFQNITYYPIFGKPFILYLGTITLISFLITASIGILNRKGKTKIPLSWHTRMASVSIILGIIHGLLGILAYF